MGFMICLYRLKFIFKIQILCNQQPIYNEHKPLIPWRGWGATEPELVKTAVGLRLIKSKLGDVGFWSKTNSLANDSKDETRPLIPNPYSLGARLVAREFATEPACL